MSIPPLKPLPFGLPFLPCILQRPRIDYFSIFMLVAKKLKVKLVVYP